MEPRAGEMQGLMERCGVHYPNCPVCSAEGRGMQSDFTGHIIGQHHFKRLCRICLLDGQPIEELRQALWDAFLLPGGAVRINHADGAIEMCRGRPAGGVTPLTITAPSMLAIADRSAPGVLQQTPMAPPPMVNSPFYDSSFDAVDLQTVCQWVQNPGQTVPPVPSDGQWYRITQRATCPNSDNGNYSAYPHLQSKNTWKQHMQRPALVMGNILDHFGVYAECSVCNANRSFHEHVPAQKHYTQLWELFLGKNGPLEAIRNTAWQEWKNLGVDKMSFRFNHIDGETHARYGGQVHGQLRAPAPAAGMPAAFAGHPQGADAPPTFGSPPLNGAVPVAGQVPVQCAAPTKTMPTPPPSTDDLSPGVRGLQMWLWQRHMANAGDQLAAACEARQVSPGSMFCAVCYGGEQHRVYMHEGVKEHLLSKRHVESLEKRLLTQQPGWSGMDNIDLEQKFTKHLGLKLDHLTGTVTAL